MKRKHFWLVMLVVALALGMAACGEPEEDTSELGSISIEENVGGFFVGDPLKADYIPVGTEIEAYQWNLNDVEIPNATSDKYTPVSPGTYTVTVSATGYPNKTSAPVEVKADYRAFLGNWKGLIAPSGSYYETLEITATKFKQGYFYTGTPPITQGFEFNIAATGWTKIDTIPGWASATVGADAVYYKLTVDGTVTNNGYLGDGVPAVLATNGLHLFLKNSGTELILFRSQPNGTSLTPAGSGYNNAPIEYKKQP